MKFKKVLAALSAMALAATMAVSASADGSVTLTRSGWWDQKELFNYDAGVNTLFGDTDPADVESITFTADEEFNVGYNGYEVTGQDEKTGEDSYWNQVSGTEITVDVADIQTGEGGYLAVSVSGNDDVEFDVSWTLNTTDDAIPYAIYFAANPYTMDRDENWAGWDWHNGEEVSFNADGTLEFVFNFEDVINAGNEYPEGSFANVGGVQFFFAEEVFAEEVLADNEKLESVSATLTYVIYDEAGNILAEGEAPYPSEGGNPVQVGFVEDGTSWEDLIALGNITVVATVSDIDVVIVEDTEDDKKDDPKDDPKEDPKDDPKEDPKDDPKDDGKKDDTTTKNPTTGVTAGLALAGLALAGAAIVVTKKND